MARDAAALAAVRDELDDPSEVTAVPAATAGLDVGLLVSAAGFGTAGALVTATR